MHHFDVEAGASPISKKNILFHAFQYATTPEIFDFA
jgi:hypothetical protein